MERRALNSAKLSKVAGKRSKSSITVTSQDPLRRRRITRSMQRKMTTLDVNMKENTSTEGTTSTAMMNQEMSLTTPVVGYAPRLYNLHGSSSSSSHHLPKQQHTTQQLACKENILEYSDGLGSSTTSSSSSSASSFAAMRPKQQQQQQLYQYAVGSGYLQQHYQQQQHLEVGGDCISDEPGFDMLTPNSQGSEFRGGHANFQQSQYLGFSGHAQSGHAASGGVTPASSRLQQTHFRKMKMSQLMSCDLVEGGGVSTPLPHLQWARSADLWRTMRSKDRTKAAPEAELRLHHPEILSNMRIILLDWIMEVCEEYKLHRETYYLAMDMFDRFMDSRSNVQKSQLQLLGVTCLFIAAKIEEIYPPKAADFAYVTDGACSVADLLDTELIVCKVLKWKLNHNMVTVNTWVNTYMQLGSHHFRPPGAKAKEFEFPAYSAVEFPKVMKLLDLCSLDIASRQFGSSVLAASAVFLQCERAKTNLSLITGFDLRDIQMCVNWMRPLAVILSQKPTLTKKSFPGVIPQDVHNIQTHDVSISMLEDSMELRRSQETTPSQYSLLQDCSVMMTPPRNERRCLAPINTS